MGVPGAAHVDNHRSQSRRDATLVRGEALCKRHKRDEAHARRIFYANRSGRKLQERNCPAAEKNGKIQWNKFSRPHPRRREVDFYCDLLSEARSSSKASWRVIVVVMGLTHTGLGRLALLCDTSELAFVEEVDHVLVLLASEWREVDAQAPDCVLLERKRPSPLFTITIHSPPLPHSSSANASILAMRRM